MALNVFLDAPVWSGSQSSAWNTTTANWNLQSNGGTTTYYTGDAVLFSDTAGSGSVALNSGNVTPGSVTFSNSSLAYTLSGSNGIVGSASLSKSGAAMLTISNSNGYTGGTTLYGGILALGNGTALGSGTLTLNGGTLQAAASGITLANAVSARAVSRSARARTRSVLAAR